jgi:hypothetical protein
MLSRQEHENLTDVKLVRKRTQAKNNAAAAGHAQRSANFTESQHVVGTVRKNSVLHKPHRREQTAPSGPNELRSSNTGPPSSFRTPAPPAGAMPSYQRDHRRYPTGPGPVSPRPPNRREGSTGVPPQQRISSNVRPPVVSSPAPLDPIPLAPESLAPTPQAPAPQPASSIQSLPTKGAATFEEMGIHTAKLEEKDCRIM